MSSLAFGLVVMSLITQRAISESHGRRARSGKAALGFRIQFRRQRAFPQDLDVVAQVGGVGGADDSGIQVRIAEG